ncbi:ulp1 protease family, C-terminal catalytic domain-containing protein [Tanacetum coccineum]
MKTKAHKKKKRKGKRAELEEGDKNASESNKEPPLRMKNFDALSFVDVRKLKGDMLVLKGAKTASKKESVGDNRKKDNVEEKKETVKKKESKKDKDQGQIMVVEKGKEVVVNEKMKCDPVNILSRMSPSHLKNVLESLTTQQVRVLEELGLGEYHNNFNFISTPGALGMWIAKNYDPEEHTIKMVDGRKIKVTRELIHDILGVPMGEREVNALLNTTSEDLIYCSSTVSPTTVVERKAPIFKHWSTKLLKKRQVEELKNGGFGQLPILEEIGSMSREDELEQFKSKTLQVFFKTQDMKDCLNDNLSKIKALLLDTDDKLKIGLDENPEDSDLKMILGKILGFFNELYHRDVDNAMVVFDKGNDVPEEAVKDNEVSKEKDDVPEKEKDDVAEKEKDVEKVVEREKSEFGNSEVEKNTEDLIKGADVFVEISKQEVSKGVLAIYEEPLKNSESQTSIFDSQPEDSQDSQPRMEIGAGIQEENHEPIKKVDFPLIGLEDIESSKGGGRNLFDEKSTVQNVNEDDMILQDSLLNIPFLSTQEVACLEIITQKSPQIQKQGILKSFPSNKLKLLKYVLPDGQAIVEKCQEDMLTETLIFHGKETNTFDSIKSKLVKNNDGMAQCMKEKSIDEVKGKSADFKSGHPTIKRQQIKKEMEGDKNVPKTRAKKTDADKQDIKFLNFIHPPIDIESEKRQGKPSNLLVSPFYQRKVILDKPVSEEGKKIVEYIWSKNTPEGDKLSGDGNVYCHTVIMTQHSVEMGKDLEARRDSFDKNIDIVLKQVKRNNFKDVNLVFFPTIKMSKKSNHFYVMCFNLKASEIDIIDNINNGIDDIKTRYGGFPCALMESFIDYLERKKHQNCYDLILAEPKLVEFPWKTTYNSHDCGVFVIRHMETYLGKVIFYKNSRKKDQKVQLNMMRTKYMVKILLMSFNEKKKTLLKQAQEYIKMKPKSSKVLTGNDVRVDE